MKSIDVKPWSPKAHDKVLENSFNGIIPKDEIEIIKQASRDFDDGSGDMGNTQSAERSHMHSMVDGENKKQSQDDAIKLRNKFVNEKLQEARKLYLDGNKKEALIKFGQATHPLVDKSSPAHKDETGKPKTWNGIFSIKALEHSPYEFIGQETAKDLTPEILKNQKELLNKLYKETFK